MWTPQTMERRKNVYLTDETLEPNFEECIRVYLRVYSEGPRTYPID